jgi:histidinol dehydrogenase
MNLYRYPQEQDLAELIRRPSPPTVNVTETVTRILDQVRQGKDEMLHILTRLLDKADLDSLEVPWEEMQEASRNLAPALKQAIERAYENIYRFHAAQQEQPEVVETSPGVRCWRKSVPVEKVGLYIPGGSAPLFSTVLMLGTPARIAGCREVILCTPPDRTGKVNPAILYAAQVTGISRVFRVGGAQAIAAMAYGTETIPAVSKLFGPGNSYVTAAKQLVSLEGVAIDLPAGPSEVLVLADSSCVPAWVAADLLSQAEHGPDSQVILITTEEQVLAAVLEEMSRQLSMLPRRDIAAEALKNSKAILVSSFEEAMRIANAYAPEHLILACENPAAAAAEVVNAGSVFLGNFSPESAGDYASGTNHTLPTAGFARGYSGVSLDSFVRKITFQELTKEGLADIGPVIETMAAAEGLEGHRNAVSIRLKTL